MLASAYVNSSYNIMPTASFSIDSPKTMVNIFGLSNLLNVDVILTVSVDDKIALIT